MPTIYKNGLVYGGSAGTANLIQATDVNGNTSNVQAELDKIAPLNYSALNHNNIYRGIMLVDEVNNTGKYTLEELYQMVDTEDASDIYIGDIIRVNRAAVTYTPAGGSSTTDPAQVIDWVVMGIDWQRFMGSYGTARIENFHLVLVPKDGFKTLAHMNSTNITTGGFISSDMFTNILPAYQTAILNSLNGHLVYYEDYFSSAVDANVTSTASGSYAGATSANTTATVVAPLLNEIEIYGFQIASSDIRDKGRANAQLPGFRLNPRLMVKDIKDGTTSRWWASGVVRDTRFLAIGESGDPQARSASSTAMIVPKVIFGRDSYSH